MVDEIKALDARLEELWAVFSKEAVLKGSFDRYAEDTRGKRGTSEVDAEFLREIEGWRDELARNIAIRNPDLSVDDLNFAVQTTIDRIIFLRIAEGRGAEPYASLLALVNGADIYKRLIALYRKADARYNSGLFDFKADRLTTDLVIDDKVLKPILQNLYYPQSPYEFSVLPAEILGDVYEQFLGKVIRLTKGHRAVVEEKPEVKKAGGVYYTPAYIVDYIVQRTVGELCEGKSPKQMEKLRILDPACGSGSFLLKAYQELLDRHLAWYRNHQPEKHRKEVFPGPGGDWRLTTAEKRRIVLNNIFGVDIDRQAVEVTKLSLLLKVLEGENDETLKQHSLFGERALPSLERNIQCGNSLIESDFLGEIQVDGEADFPAVAMFDWASRFKEAINGGGFDAVIGNPPYGALFSEAEKHYLFRKYPLIIGQPESYEYFMIRCLGLLKAGGFLSMIVPTNFTESQRAEGLRRALLEGTAIHVIQSFRYNVWKRNAAETLVFCCEKGGKTATVCVGHPASPDEFSRETGTATIKQERWLETPGNRFLMRADASLLERIERGNRAALGDVCDVSQGVIIYRTREESARNAHVSDAPKSAVWKPLLDGASSIAPYSLTWGSRYLHYGDWLWRKREVRFFEEPKLLFVRLRNKSLRRRLVGTYDDAGYYNTDNFNNIIVKNPSYPLKYVLGLFNSSVLNYWYRAYFDNVNINPAQVRLLPLPSLDAKKAIDRSRRDRLVGLVDRLLSLSSRLPMTKSAAERDRIVRQQEALTAEVDRLVYELYGLTNDEIAIVEGASAP